MRNPRKLAVGAALIALALFAVACGSGDGDSTDTSTGGDTGGGDKGTLTVGAVAFAENQIVAELYAQVLEDAGYAVKRQTELGSREILQPAMVAGEVDIAPEYLGSLLLFLDPKAEASGDPDQNESLLEQALGNKGLQLLNRSAANDTNSFVVTAETADKYKLAAMSDLAPVAGDLTLGGPPECPDRPFCIPGLKKTYGIDFGDFKPLDVGGPLTVAALQGGKIDVGLLFSTSSVIGAKGWVVLEDDKALQTAENITPLVRSDSLNDEIAELLNTVSAALTTPIITELNGRVEIDQESPADVAADFLSEQGIL